MNHKQLAGSRAARRLAKCESGAHYNNYCCAFVRPKAARTLFAMSRLTAAVLSSKFAPQDLREATVLDLADQHLANVEELGACVCLRKLSLQKNELTSFDGSSCGAARVILIDSQV